MLHSRRELSHFRGNPLGEVHAGDIVIKAARLVRHRPETLESSFSKGQVRRYSCAEIESESFYVFAEDCRGTIHDALLTHQIKMRPPGELPFFCHTYEIHEEHLLPVIQLQYLPRCLPKRVPRAASLPIVPGRSNEALPEPHSRRYGQRDPQETRTGGSSEERGGRGRGGDSRSRPWSESTTSRRSSNSPRRTGRDDRSRQPRGGGAAGRGGGERRGARHRGAG